MKIHLFEQNYKNDTILCIKITTFKWNFPIFLTLTPPSIKKIINVTHFNIMTFPIL